MELNIVMYLVLGLALFGMTFLPRLLRQHPLTVPFLYVAIGFGLFWLPFDVPPLEIVYDAEDRSFIEYFTEILVIISLAGAGLKIDRAFGWKAWSVGWRLLGIAMPLTIFCVALLGFSVFALAPASAILLGACLAPTDPVLAEDVQVAPPHEGKENEVRFGLTLEAGLNDALAFPFVYLAIAAANHQSVGLWLGQWFALDVLYRCVIGTLLGILFGKLLTRYLMHHSDLSQRTDEQEKEGSEGLFVIAAILLVYSLTELAQGYGFLAVFVAAAVGKRSSKEEFNISLYRFVSQIERLLLAGVLIGFGLMLAKDSALLANGSVWLIGAIIVLVIRPILGFLSTSFSQISIKHRLALAFFGIKGVGSLYYLSYALRKGDFPGAEVIWATIAASITLSLVVHGLTASRIMRELD